ncbi:ArsR family transcriptional regulator [Actibacterium mucosum KCTC 23349]|uniref:ArsR family transcriptional regulator n=2 Tax=Actibacterium TaxID=1433986 RepID=A0A037ZG94_9RHOB|nr:ArsR family transcriptional regulator [Actibacterium mucosum KCTC 23349]
MKEGPDISRLSALIGDPARANMLSALMAGKALTAGELAYEAGVSAATASGHLRQMAEAGLIEGVSQGRHRYFRLADEHVQRALEALMSLAAQKGHLRSRTGPRDPALRAARVCYDHLAGAQAVEIYEVLTARGLFAASSQGIALSTPGRAFFAQAGFDVAAMERARRPTCRACLDWSERRYHLAGSLGAALLQRVLDEGWAIRAPDSRVVTFREGGQGALAALLQLG